LYAEEKGHESMVRLLLKKGAEPDFKDTDGWTPLLYEAENRHEVVMRLLLEKDAEPDSKDTNGRTPISYAAWGDHESPARPLLTKSIKRIQRILMVGCRSHMPWGASMG
jgi:ankyrin repeat protein